jgi:PAS domain S-box-containing protein
MVVEDVRKHPLPVGAPAGRQGAIMGLPLILGSTVVGVMNVYFPAPRHFAQIELDALGLLASHAAIAIQNAQLYEAIRRSNEDLERRVAERTAELEGERNRIRTILDSAGEGIYLTNPEGVIYYVNPANEQLTGYAFAEALGQTPDLWRSGLTLPSVIEGMERYLQHGEGWEGEVIFRRKDGTLYDAALTVTPVHDGGGRLVGFVGVQRDITRFKELDRLKDQFVTRIGHEMRTPLANVVLSIDLLEHGRPDKRVKYMETLHSEAARLRKLVDEFLEIAELDVARDLIRLVPTNLNHLTSSLIAGHRTLATQRGLALGDYLDPHLPLAEVDPTLVDRAISLVLENALNYTPRGGRITIMTGSLQQEERDWVTISVQDTGPGILPEEMPHIFERFYRGKVASDYTIPGSGLGLAICKAIVDQLGGRITVDSQPGRGATFTLWLRPAQNLNS